MNAPFSPNLTHSAPLASSLEEGLQTIFGFGEFRPGQRDVMEAILEQKDALIVMPTGSGKSLCYQLPACVMDGLTLVVSPLIALMKDQVDALDKFNIPGTFINSSISGQEQLDRLHNMEMGHYKIVYVAPERFKSNAFRRALSQVKISLFAIDEAHCISGWGHDFRPDYLLLDKVRADLGNPTTVALTATATSQVQRDIIAQLSLDEADVFVYGFERPNLFFEVFDSRSKTSKIERIQALLHSSERRPALIYCATRKQVEEVVKDLSAVDISCGMYHAGLSDNQRERVQSDYMNDEFEVMVATNAFGMGVDKSNIRSVIHYNVPGSIESYYQEAGRAGRDLGNSHCLLLFNYADRGIHEFFNDQTYPTRDTIEQVWSFVANFGLGTHNINAQHIADSLSRQSRGKRLNSWGVESSLRVLARAGHLEFGMRDGFPWIAVNDLARTRDLRVDWDYIEARRSINEGLLADVIRLASGRTCRQLYLLRYFNSRPSFDGGCGHCDVCCGPPAYVAEANLAPAEKIPLFEDAPIAIQKILAGVTRARGRFGAHMVAGMLRGAKSKKLLQTSLTGLSTYGILSGMKQQHIVSLLDILLRHDLLARDEHGCIGITPAGTEVMMDPGLLSATLTDILEHRTQRRGSGAPRRSASAPRAGAASRPSATGDTYKDTLEMIQQGKTIEEIVQARDIKTQSVLRHLMVLADRGDRFDLSAYIQPQLLEAVRTAASDWTYGDALSPVKDAAPACTYDELKLHLTQVLLDRHAQDA